jgi:hypothetical protein
MPNFAEISTGTKVMLGAGILMLISLFLPWQDFGNEATEALGLDASWNGWHGALGVLVGIALIALLAWVVIQVLNVKLNFDLPITEAWLTLGLGIAVIGLTVIKLLSILGDEATIWSFVGTILAAAVAFGAWLRAQELGGVSFERTGAGVPRTDEAETMRADTDTMRTTDTGMPTTTEPEMPPPRTTEDEAPPRRPSA